MGFQELRYKMQDFDLRGKLNDNPMVMVTGLTLLIITCFSLIICHFSGGGSVSNKAKLIYFDTKKQQIRVVEHEYPELPASPLEGEEGVYLAAVFSCVDQEPGAVKEGMTLEDLQANDMFIGWLEQSDGDAMDADIAFEETYLYKYRMLDGDKWYSIDEPGFRAIQTWPYEKCADAVRCRP